MKKIGILGSGAVAKALSLGFKKNNYEVMLGTRDQQKLVDFATQHTLKTGSFEETAVFADIVVLAVKGTAAKSALELAGKQNLRGKIIIDTTNPIESAPPVKGVLSFFSKINESLMELLQKEFSEAHFVKAFNSVGSAFMVNPDFNGQTPSMFICGDNDIAKKEVAGILNQFGWETEDMGDAISARAIEPLCMLWCIRGFKDNSWSHAFKLLKK